MDRWLEVTVGNHIAVKIHRKVIVFIFSFLNVREEGE